MSSTPLSTIVQISTPEDLKQMFLDYKNNSNSLIYALKVKVNALENNYKNTVTGKLITNVSVFDKLKDDLERFKNINASLNESMNAEKYIFNFLKEKKFQNNPNKTAKFLNDTWPNQVKDYLYFNDKFNQIKNEIRNTIKGITKNVQQSVKKAPAQIIPKVFSDSGIPINNNSSIAQSVQNIASTMPVSNTNITLVTPASSAQNLTVTQAVQTTYVDMTDPSASSAQVIPSKRPASGVVESFAEKHKDTINKWGWGIIIGSVSMYATVKIRKMYSIAKVKKLTRKAIESNHYKEVIKYTNALKKIARNEGLMNKLLMSEPAVNLADISLETIRNGYITVGASLVISSLLLCLILGLSISVTTKIEKLLKNLDCKGVLKLIGTLSAFALVLLPAVAGICLIVVALNGLTDKGIAAYFLTKFSPAIRLANEYLRTFA